MKRSIDEWALCKDCCQFLSKAMPNKAMLNKAMLNKAMPNKAMLNKYHI